MLIQSGPVRLRTAENFKLDERALALLDGSTRLSSSDQDERSQRLDLLREIVATNAVMRTALSRQRGLQRIIAIALLASFYGLADGLYRAGVLSNAAVCPAAQPHR